MRMRAITLSAALLAALALAGCSSSDSTSTPASAVASPAASGQMVGGMTECTKDAIQGSVDQAVAAMGGDNMFTIDGVDCADGWAVVNGLLGPKNPPADGPQGAPTSMVFEAEGQFWIPKDKQAVCGTYDSASPDAVPADAQIPAALYASACLAG